jgi:TRAP-type mannitol/chloroaromatic compound transport system permease small subunit
LKTRPLYLEVILLGLFAFGGALIVQLIYGGILYVVLKRLDWLNLPIILLAYVAPVIAFSWHASDTTNDIVGTIPWIVFALTNCGICVVVLCGGRGNQHAVLIDAKPAVLGRASAGSRYDPAR